MSSQKTSISRPLVLALLCAALTTVWSCTETTTTTTESCDLTASGFSLSSTSLTRGQSLGDSNGSNSAGDAGSVTLTQDMGLSTTRLRDLSQQLYLSTDNQYSNSDIALTAFTNTPTTSGNSTTIKYDQIDIPSNAATGAAFILLHISGEPCPTGGSIPTVNRSVAVTIN